jgi:predicted metal-dependent hydrolase
MGLWIQSTRSRRVSVTTEQHNIEVRGMSVEVVRKGIKNLHVGVYPPNGRVRVAAPLRLDDEAVRLAIISRLGWIRRKQESFQQQDRQSQREMVTGESHYLQGRRYRLVVNEQHGPQSVNLLDKTTMELRVRRGVDRDGREAVLQRWYRLHLRAQLPALLRKWEPEVGVEAAEVRIKKMKTRWGTCNREAKRIWLNLELAKKSLSCLEYILVHEMVHLLERHHNERFGELMDKLMPSWRLYREELNRAPLAHEEWRY